MNVAAVHPFKTRAKIGSESLNRPAKPAVGMTTEIIELLAPIEGEYTRVAPNAAMAAFEGTVGASAERAAARPKSPCGGIMRSEISGICVGGRLCTGH